MVILLLAYVYEKLFNWLLVYFSTWVRNMQAQSMERLEIMELLIKLMKIRKEFNEKLKEAKNVARELRDTFKTLIEKGQQTVIVEEVKHVTRVDVDIDVLRKKCEEELEILNKIRAQKIDITTCIANRIIDEISLEYFHGLIDPLAFDDP